MISSRKAQVNAINNLVMPMIIVVILGVAFAYVITGFGTNYDVSVDDYGYEQIANRSADISIASERMTDAIVGTNQSQTNVLTSVERLSTGAYNSILVFSEVPGLYKTIIDSVSYSLGIPSAITNIVFWSIGFSIVGVLLYLILGRS